MDKARLGHINTMCTSYIIEFRNTTGTWATGTIILPI